MNEDAQPNERPFDRKGGGVPIIRSTQPIGRGRGSQRGGYGYPATWFNPSKPINGTLPGTYHSAPSHHHHHQQHPHPSKRSQRSYQKRRRTDTEYSTGSSPRKGPTNAYSAPTPFVSQKPAKRKAQLDPPVDLLVEVPPRCNKEAPVSHTVSAKSGGRVLLDGHQDDGARAAKRRTISKQYGIGLTSGMQSPAIETIPTPSTGSNTNPTEDEIIIVGDVDELDEHQRLLLPVSPMQTDLEHHMRYPSPLQLSEFARSKTRELIEPTHVFKSGVLSLSSKGDGGPFTLEALPSSPAPHIPWKASAGSVFSDDNDSMILYQPGLVQESGSLLSKPAVNQRASASFNRETENRESASVRYELALKDPFLRLPLSQSDKIRRILQLDATTALTVSMRGSVDLIDTASLQHQRTLKSPTSGESIDAACFLRAGDEYVTIFGHARDKEQVSWSRAQYGTNQSEFRYLLRPWNTAKKGGVSATTTMMQPLQFATGGYDHIVHLWDLNPDLSSASPRQLAIKHTSLVQSLLAIRDTSHKLVSAGADCNVHFWDLSSERIVNTLRPSNATYHIHPTTSPFCTLLEIAHRELQFEVRDHRLVPESPVLRFGYNTSKFHGRFITGATSSDLFACGSRDGSVRVWDLRNVKSAPITTTIHPGQKIVQVIFEQSNLVACSEGGQTSLVGYKSD